MKKIMYQNASRAPGGGSVVLDPDELTLIAPDSPAGYYLGPRGGVIYVDPDGEQQRLRHPIDLTPRPPVADATAADAGDELEHLGSERNQSDHHDHDDRQPAGSGRYRDVDAARAAMAEWAGVYRRRDEVIRSASAAGIGVNQIARSTGVAKTTVIRVLKR